MKVTVIGYWGAYPDAGSATSCYLIEKDGFTLLLDCGSGALSRLQSYKHVMDLDAVILSHYHQDHMADIGVLQYSWLVQRYLTNQERTLPIYGHREDEQAFKKLTHSYTDGVAYDPNQTLTVGPFQINFLKTTHPVPCFAMRITDGDSTVVYTADTSYQEGLIPFSKNADLLIAECSFYEDQDGTDAGHLNSREVGKIASLAEVNQLLLTHLPHFGDLDKLVLQAGKLYKGKIELAKEGLKWEKAH